ncbi:MAG: GNAT family N-acetyltransferase [Rhodomicrobium sp.]
MFESQLWGGTIRRMWASENDKFRDHLLRLDRESRRTRFGMAVSDGFIKDYALTAGGVKCLVYGYFVEGEMCAAAEMRQMGDDWHADAEGAFSVEREHQNRGLGTELLGRIIRAARNRGVTRLYMNCLAENHKMQRISRKFDAELHFDHGEVVGRVLPALLTYLSLWQEALDDSNGFVLAAFDSRVRMTAQALRH